MQGQPIRLSSLWQQRPVLLAFTRHFGCTQCKEMLRELKAWNDRMDKENRPSMKITFKSVMQTVAARRAENKPTKKNLQKKAEQQAVWH